MEKIILGLLMLKRLTVYELRSLIRNNFRSMCSDSLGSIQAAVKKLLAAGRVTCSEYVEKSVNKKQYSITDDGRQAFMDWLVTPADMTAFRNMELGKLLFMGFVPSEKRLSLIDEIISNLENELSGLLELWESIQSLNADEEIIETIECLKNDTEYLTGIINATQNPDIFKSATEIGTFELMTLRYGLDSVEFNLSWFRVLREKIVNEELTFPPQGI